MVLWIVIGIGAWIAIGIGAIALCRAAASGDETVITPDRPHRHVTGRGITQPARPRAAGSRARWTRARR